MLYNFRIDEDALGIQSRSLAPARIALFFVGMMIAGKINFMTLMIAEYFEPA